MGQGFVSILTKPVVINNNQVITYQAIIPPILACLQAITGDLDDLDANSFSGTSSANKCITMIATVMGDVIVDPLINFIKSTSIP